MGDIRLSPADRSAFSPKNSSSACYWLQSLHLAACSWGTVFLTGSRLQPQDMRCYNSQLETDDKKTEMKMFFLWLLH